MATAARFGRLPRSAPSLTSTIVALAQEYQRVRESNIVDAWKNGGEFEGKKVTDKMVLDWMKARRNELSSDDPKWDYYDNQVTQYTFAIENSKMEVKYAKKQVSDSEMAGFYHKWARKLPPDSEAYRQREKLAAQYNDRAASGRAGSRRAAADNSYNNAITKSYEKEATYNVQLAFIHNEAVNRGILRPGEDISSIDPATADGARLNALWDEIATAPEYADERKFYAEQIRANGNPNFKGNTGFTKSEFMAQQRTKDAAVSDRIRAARKEGRKGDITAFTKERDGVRFLKQSVNGLDETEAYEQAREAWEDEVTRSDATPLEKDRATQKYIGQLDNLRESLDKTKRPDEVDPRMGWLENEIRTLGGRGEPDEHPLEHWGGALSVGTNTGLSSATETALSVKQNQQDIDNLNKWTNGQPDYVLVKMDPKNGDLLAAKPGTNAALTWGVVPRTSLPAETTYVTQDDHGDPRSPRVVTAVIATPIFTSATKTTATGTKTTTGEQPVGYSYVMPDGTTGYKYKSSEGKWLYTPDNPFLKTDPATGVKTPYDMTDDTKKGGVVINTGAVGNPPQASRVVDPEYLKPSTVEVKGRIAKSGYALWLIGSDPKKNAAFATNTKDVLSMLTLEAGTGPDAEARLAEMVLDADSHRAVYVGNSTEEQQRIRRNYLTGSPNPVGLTTLYPGATKDDKTNARTEAGMTALLTGGGRDVVIDEMREANRLGMKPVTGTAAPTPTARPGATDQWANARKYGIAPTPPPATTKPALAPTSLGAPITTSIASTLTGYLGNLTAGKPIAPPQRPAGMTGIAPTAPKPTAPKPVAPPPKPPEPEPIKPKATPTPVAKPIARAPQEKVYNIGGR